MAEETNTNGTQQISEPSTTSEPAGALSGGGDPKFNAEATEPKTAVSKDEPAKSENTPSAEEIAEFRKWQESQKSDAEKQAAAIGKAEKAKQAAEERAAAAELKFTAMSKGVSAEALNDVIALAKTKITDKVTAEQAIDEIIKKYPAFTKSSEPSITTGVRTGGNTPPASSAKAIDIIRSEQVKRK